MLATEAGVINRCQALAVPVKSRRTYGVSIMKLDAGDKVRSVCLAPASGAAAGGDDDDEEEEA